jgi:hypothetical protein
MQITQSDQCIHGVSLCYAATYDGDYCRVVTRSEVQAIAFIAAGLNEVVP